MIRPGIDHLALTVPDLEHQVDGLTGVFGMVIDSRTEHFAVVADPVTGLKLELSRSHDNDVHVRHVRFLADNVDAAHQQLVAAGMGTAQPPHHRDATRVYTSFLTQPGGVEIQLVRYDDDPQ